MFRSAKKMEVRANKTTQGKKPRVVQENERGVESMRNQSPKKLQPAPKTKKRGPILESGCVSIAPPAGANEGEIDWVKVEMLRAAIEDGSYVVDATAVAEAIVDRDRKLI
jgi:anti-sigma28 factor (negative regulator of flagellin synthesis)